MLILILFITMLILILLAAIYISQKKNKERETQAIQTTLAHNFFEHRAQLDKRQIEHLTTLQDSLQKSLYTLREEINNTLNRQTETLNKRVDTLTEKTDLRLKEISGQVDKRLTEGFEKTQTTFTDVVKRLALIDEAQKKITELSSNVVSLQNILSDKRSRGAFGEVQLSSLIRNMLSENNFAFQYTLSNNNRVDCMLFLPEPTGHIAVDAKFPLESYRKLTELAPGSIEQKPIEQQFKKDIKKHINDIANKYIIPGETSDAAIMFIPAEAVFAEIHAHYPELIEISHRARVWLVSPTTMMAIITTARAVLKDAATREQIHIIQEHLRHLGQDFGRFQQRMDKLATHIDQAQQDVQQVHTSAKKITSRFNKIERVELIENNEK